MTGRLGSGIAASAAALLVTAGALACASAPSPRARDERMLFVQGGAGRLRVSDGGAGGPPVVFLHGLGSDLESWREHLDHLRLHRRAIAYDQRGHGGSDRARDGGGYTIDALAVDLALVVDALKLDRFYLVGHSMSGEVLTAYVGAHPERVLGLVYVDAVGDLREVPSAALDEVVRAEAAQGFGLPEIRAAFAGMLGASARPATRERVLGSLDRLDPPAFAALRRSLFAFRIGDRLAGYRGPILAIEADGEPNPVLASNFIATARRVGVPQVSHWLHMDDPVAFEAALFPFMGLGGPR
jgi:pimeloyl-ACP methyl ester carboxylesterase